MNKTDLIQQIAKNSGLTLDESQKALNGMIKAVTDALRNGDNIQLVGFGTFSVVERKERMGMNLQTKHQMVIPAKKVAKWKPSKNLMENDL